MNPSRRLFNVVALIAAASLAFAACGGSDDGDSGGTTTTGGGGPSPAGTVTVAAEQDATCTDWVSNCAASAWGAWTMMYQTMPRVFDFAKQGEDWVEVPNPMMAAMPTVAEVNGKQTVTYPISPNAVWSDGEPITSEDFRYTWDQIVTGKDIYNPLGYTSIESIDTTDPKTAVATFSEPYASWKALFAADYGIFPSHILEGKSRHKQMKDGYDWSGGPWFFDWQKGETITLTPNPRWYGTKPTIKRVVFRIITNTASEFEAFKGNQVDAMYPQSEPSAVSAIKGGIPNTNSVYTADTGAVEALWMNNDKFPFDSLAVRQAFAYGIDRDAIVEALFGDLGITEAVNSLNPPILSRFSDDAWARYTLDLNQVNSLMEGDGWTRDGDYWEKDGKTAAFTIKSTAGNKRRELTQEILQEQLGEAGFKVSIKNPSADDLFNEQLPAGNYQVALFGSQNTDLNPSLCGLFCSNQIPSEENDNSGQNTQWVAIPELDTQLETVDTTFDENERIAASKQADQIMAENQVSLPLDPLPNIAMWHDRLSGPIGDNPILAMFWNMHLWSVGG